jgi:hypothetical protein
MSLGYPLLRLPCRCSFAGLAALQRGSPSPPSVSVSLSATASSDGGGAGDDCELTAREKRQQRRERRELRATDWKEEVQDRLIHEPARRRKKPPKRTWREELNLDLLAELGPQWWLVRVSMAPGTDYVDLLTKAISRRYSEVPFKVTICSPVSANFTTSFLFVLRELNVALTSIFAGTLCVGAMLQKGL